MRIPAVAATKRASAGGSLARSGSRTNAIAALTAAERASSRQGSRSSPERTASAVTSIAPRTNPALCVSSPDRSERRKQERQEDRVGGKAGEGGKDHRDGAP